MLSLLPSSLHTRSSRMESHYPLFTDMFLVLDEVNEPQPLSVPECAQAAHLVPVQRGVWPPSAVTGDSRNASNCQPSLVPRFLAMGCSAGQMAGSNCQRGNLKPGAGWTRQ